jgi:hypothetical protein
MIASRMFRECSTLALFKLQPTLCPLVLYGGYLKASEQPQRALPKKAITVTGDSGAVVRFAVEMIVTPAEGRKS